MGTYRAAGQPKSPVAEALPATISAEQPVTAPMDTAPRVNVQPDAAAAQSDTTDEKITTVSDEEDNGWTDVWFEKKENFALLDVPDEEI